MMQTNLLYTLATPKCTLIC